MRRVLVGFTVRMGAALLASVLLMGATPQPVAASDDGAVMGPNANTSHQPIAPVSPRNTKGGTRGGTRGTRDTNTNTNTNGGTNTGAGTTNDGTTAGTTNTDTTTAATVTTDVGAATTNDGTTAATTNTRTTTATVTTDVGAATTNDGTTAATTNTATTTAEGAAAAPAVNVAGFQQAAPALPGAVAGQQQAPGVMGVQKLPSTSTDPATAATLATLGLGALAGGLLALRRR